MKPGSTRQMSLTDSIPVEFAGCSGEGELYEDKLGRLFLVRYRVRVSDDSFYSEPIEVGKQAERIG